MSIYVNASRLDTDRGSGLVYVTNTTIETRIRVKVGVSTLTNQTRESSFHFSEQ